jgi:ParB/RepB/Spo0J family partition protein
MDQELTMIRCDRIVPSPVNKRKGRNSKIEELAESIKKQGLLQRPIVRPLGQFAKSESAHEAVPDQEMYELVAGERRWRACSMIMEYMPVDVRQLTDEEAHEITFAENFEREDLSPLEQSEFIGVMLNDGKTAAQIADRFGKSEIWVVRRAKLCNLTSEIRSYIEENPESGISQWPSGHLELIARYEAHIQNELLEEFRDDSSHRITIDELKKHLSCYMMKLDKVPWKLDDVELCPIAGACSQCSKRTGVQVSLFDNDEAKNDRCLDKTCWQLKLDTFVKNKEDSLRKKNAELITVRTAYSVNEDSDELLKNAVSHYDVRECKKSEPGAVQALIVDGPEAGKTKWVQQSSKSSSSSVGKPATYEEKLEKFSKRRRVKVLDKLMGMLAMEITEPGFIISGLDDETIASIAVIWGARRYDVTVDDPDFDVRSDTLQHYRTYSKIRKKTALFSDLARCVLPGIIEILKHSKEYQNAETEFAESICEILKIDFKEIVRSVELEVKEPKSLRDLKPEETPEELSEPKGKRKGRSKKQAEVEAEEPSDEEMDA